MVRWKKWWENDIRCIIGWNVTWNIHLSSKMVKNDVKIVNRWKTGEKWAKKFKLGFLSGAMHTQERPYICKIMHAYIERILHTHKLKNRYACKSINPGYVRKKLSTHARMNTEGCSLTFSNFSQPKLNQNMFLPPRVSRFHLNPS